MLLAFLPPHLRDQIIFHLKEKRLFHHLLNDLKRGLTDPLLPRGIQNSVTFHNAVSMLFFLPSSLNARTPNARTHFLLTMSVLFLFHLFYYTINDMCISFSIFHLFFFSFLLCCKHPFFLQPLLAFLATTIFPDLPPVPFSLSSLLH